MKGFKIGTTFKEYKALLKEDLRLERVGKKVSKYTTIMNMNSRVH
jgi:hypothetical protein